MTSALRLNGIAVPMSLDNPSVTPDFIGPNKRSANAAAVATRRGSKQKWGFATRPGPSAEQWAFEQLVAGEGHVCNFDAQSYYTSQGMAPVAIGAGFAFSTSGPKYGAACLNTPATSARVTYAFFTAGRPWSLAWWFNKAAAGYHHYMLSSPGADAPGGAVSIWIDGVAQGAGTTVFGIDAVVAGVASIGETSATGKIDDIVALPFAVPTDWPAQIFGYGAGFGALPYLSADGLLIKQNTATTVLGEAPSGKMIRVGGSSDAAKSYHSFSFGLMEL